MKLDKWIETKGWARSYFAWKLGVTETTVTRYLTGARRPTPEIMKKIRRVTQGKVMPNDFYDMGSQKDSA